MTFKEAVGQCTSKDHVVVCTCTTKKEYKRLVKLLPVDSTECSPYSQIKNTFYFYPIGIHKPYGHYTRQGIVDEGRILIDFSVSTTKLLLDHVRKLQ